MANKSPSPKSKEASLTAPAHPVVASNDDEDVRLANLTAAENIEIDDKFNYEVLTSDNIVTQINDVIKEVNQVLELPDMTTTKMLQHFGWNKELLMERYYEWGQDLLLEKVVLEIFFYTKPS